MINPKVVISVSFILSIIISRLTVFVLVKTNKLKQVRPHLRSFEVHHLTTGTIILIIAGYLSLTNLFGMSKTLLAILYGFGLGLVVDELWAGSVVLSKHWYDEGKEYYKPLTYFVITIVAILLLLLIVI